MPTYDVTVNLALWPGFTWRDAELDGPEALGDHRYAVEADSPAQAEERALDKFHESVPIGLLEVVDVSVRVAPRRDDASLRMSIASLIFVVLTTISGRTDAIAVGVGVAFVVLVIVLARAGGYWPRSG
jgi:hypothetical protein